MGVIKVGEIYPLATFLQLAGMCAKTLREAERNGLEASWVGGRKYITGKAFNDFAEMQRGATPPNRGQRTTRSVTPQLSH